MPVELTKPELQRFISEQVSAGNFPSPEAVVEAAIEQMILDRQQLRLADEDVEAINHADAEIERGEFVDFDTFSAEMRKRFPPR